MTQRPASTLIEQADAAGIVLFSSAIALPSDGTAPEWITLFPNTGRVETRDGRAFDVSAATLMAAFTADGIDIPIDVNHSTDAAGMFGGRADAVGWGTELREHEGALQIRADWLAEGRELLSARKYRYTSPSFYQDQNRATRLKAVALVTSPALARQPALASAGGKPSEPSMKSIAAALGLAEGADEAACLSAVTTLQGRPALPAIAKALGLPEASDLSACLGAIGDRVPKTLHDQTVANLSGATARIDALEKASREKEVSVMFETALKERRIVPAHVATLTALCATPEGLANVKAHIAASAPGLQPSGLDERGQPAGSDGATDPTTLSAAAQKIQDEAEAAGRPISFAEAVTLAGKAATKA